MWTDLITSVRSIRPLGGGAAAGALPFREPLDALVDEPTPMFLRLWPALGAALVLSLIATAAVLQVDVVVMAQGRLTPDEPPVVLQPIGSTVLRELRVQPGARVQAGEILAVVDSTFTGADLEATRAQRRTLAALERRLEAELAGTHASGTAESGAEAELQDALMAQRAAVHSARLAETDARLSSVDAALAAERASGAGLSQQLEIAREVEGMRESLVAKGVGSRLDLLSAQAHRLQLEQEQRNHLARVEDLTHRQSAGTAERRAATGEWEQQILEELARIRPQIAQIDEQLAKAERLDALTMITAPREGIVLDTARRAPGSLVREGEPLITIVPTDVPMIAEVGLRSADIGRLREGDGVTIKVDSYPWRRHGTLSGTLRSVSRESYSVDSENGAQEAMHRAQIALGPDELRDLPPGTGLTPGMTLSADIKVGTRSVLEFFAEPLVRGLRESLREP